MTCAFSTVRLERRLLSSPLYPWTRLRSHLLVPPAKKVIAFTKDKTITTPLMHLKTRMVSQESHGRLREESPTERCLHSKSVCPSFADFQQTILDKGLGILDHKFWELFGRNNVACSVHVVQQDPPRRGKRGKPEPFLRSRVHTSCRRPRGRDEKENRAVTEKEEAPCREP